MAVALPHPFIAEILTIYGDQCHSSIIFAQASPSGNFLTFRKAVMVSVKASGKPVL